MASDSKTPFRATLANILAVDPTFHHLIDTLLEPYVSIIFTPSTDTNFADLVIDHPLFKTSTRTHISSVTDYLSFKAKLLAISISFSMIMLSSTAIPDTDDC